MSNWVVGCSAWVIAKTRVVLITNKSIRKRLCTNKILVCGSNVARPERFELPTTWFEARYSIQLSYGRVLESGD